MALNWTMLNEEGTAPVPLPSEKIFYSAPGCELNLAFKAGSAEKKWKAKGTAYVTNQRVMFVRQPLLAQESVTPDTLNTLTIPLPNFQDTRYLIPIFSAPYYEASVLPVPGGGLPETLSVTSGGSTSSSATLPARGTLTMHFNQGGGLEFRSAVEEVKARMDEMQGGVARHMESLPVYEATGGAPSAASTVAAGPSRTTNEAEMQPDDATIEAASVAVELDEREREAAQRGSIVAQQESLFPDRRGSYSSQQPSSADESQQEQHGMIHPADASLPPAYDEACD